MSLHFTDKFHVASVNIFSYISGFYFIKFCLEYFHLCADTYSSIVAFFCNVFLWFWHQNFKDTIVAGAELTYLLVASIMCKILTFTLRKMGIHCGVLRRKVHHLPYVLKHSFYSSLEDTLWRKWYRWTDEYRGYYSNLGETG